MSVLRLLANKLLYILVTVLVGIIAIPIIILGLFIAAELAIAVTIFYLIFGTMRTN